MKRLGFLIERLSGPSKLTKWCKERMTTGNARLDSALKCTRLVTRWRLVGSTKLVDRVNLTQRDR